MRSSVRPGTVRGSTISPGFSRDSHRYPDTPEAGVLFRNGGPISARCDSGVPAPVNEKRELSPGRQPSSPGSVALPRANRRQIRDL